MQQKQKIEESQKTRLEQEERINNAKDKNDTELQRKRKVNILIIFYLKLNKLLTINIFYFKKRILNQNRKKQRKKGKFTRKKWLDKRPKTPNNLF